MSQTVDFTGDNLKPDVVTVPNLNDLVETTGPSITYGSGAPSATAAKGSLYIRTDGSSTSTRLYVNTDAGTTWTNVTTAA